MTKKTVSQHILPLSLATTVCHTTGNTQVRLGHNNQISDKRNKDQTYRQIVTNYI